MITYIVSNIEHALAFEWVATYLPNENISLSFILLNPAENVPLEIFLKEKNIPTLFVKYRGKKDIFSAIWKVRKQLKMWKTNVVHCHLFDANVVGLLASKSLGIKKRIYTRHHSDYHHVYFPRAVYYDRFVNYLATDIVAISGAVKEILEKKEFVNPKKIQLIPHGFKLDIFELDKNNPDIQNRIDALRTKYSTKNFFPVIGVIARYTSWKGIQYIIPAVSELLKKYPKAKILLANAKGDYKNEIQNLLKTLIPENQYQEIPYETDLGALYQLFDVYVHTPIDAYKEAFGQTYIEALASGIPSVFSLSGIASEFIQHEHNACVVPFENSEKITENIIKILENEDLKNKIIENGKKDIQNFKLNIFIEKLKNLYLGK